MNEQNNIVVPPGKSLSDVPKSAAKPIPSNQPKPPNTKLTLQMMVSENETKNYLIELLVELGKKRGKGRWREYLEFYRTNLSGDISSMKPAVLAKCEALVKDLNEEYFKQQDL